MCAVGIYCCGAHGGPATRKAFPLRLVPDSDSGPRSPMLSQGETCDTVPAHKGGKTKWVFPSRRGLLPSFRSHPDPAAHDGIGVQAIIAVLRNAGGNPDSLDVPDAARAIAQEVSLLLPAVQDEGLHGVVPFTPDDGFFLV